MARKNDYGLPDETLQLIAAGPDLIKDPRYLQARQTFDSRMPGSELIKALRSYGTDNSGFTRYANDSAAGPTRPLAGRRGLFNPSQLGMKRIPRDVTLPGAETARVMGPLILDPLVYPEILDDEVIDDPVIDPVDPPVDPLDPDLPVPPDLPPTPPTPPIQKVDPKKDDEPIGTRIIDDFGTRIIDDFGTGTATVDGGTGNDTITGGGGNDGPNLESSIAAILASRLTGTGGTGGTGGGDGGSGTGGTGGLTGTGTTGGTGTTTTTSTTTGTTGTLRDAISKAVNGTASVDGTASGADAGAGSNLLGSNLTADQLSALTKPKVPSVTIESSGPALDDKGSLSTTYDYPEFLTPEELKAYEQWLKQSSGLPGGGATGGGKPADDTYGNILEM